MRFKIPGSSLEIVHTRASTHTISRPYLSRPKRHEAVAASPAATKRVRDLVLFSSIYGLLGAKELTHYGAANALPQRPLVFENGFEAGAEAL